MPSRSEISRFVAPVVSSRRTSRSRGLSAPAPALADAAATDRALASVTMSRNRLALDSPSSVLYLESLRRSQDAVASRIERAIPGPYVHWRYGITIDALAVVV